MGQLGRLDGDRRRIAFARPDYSRRETTRSPRHRHGLRLSLGDRRGPRARWQ
jgi:hypothetical protein